jgi:hypothetical protein
MEQIKKDKLIIALQEEKNLFSKKGHNTKDHELSIHFLRTNEVNGNVEFYEILESCINDFECIFSDYCI